MKYLVSLITRACASLSLRVSRLFFFSSSSVKRDITMGRSSGKKEDTSIDYNQLVDNELLYAKAFDRNSDDLYNAAMGTGIAAISVTVIAAALLTYNKLTKGSWLGEPQYQQVLY